jgi:hypothetical protein
MKEVLDFTDRIGFNLIIVAISNPAALNLAVKIEGKIHVLTSLLGC